MHADRFSWPQSLRGTEAFEPLRFWIEEFRPYTLKCCFLGGTFDPDSPDLGPRDSDSPDSTLELGRIRLIRLPRRGIRTIRIRKRLGCGSAALGPYVFKCCFQKNLLRLETMFRMEGFREGEGEKGWMGVFMGESCLRAKVIRHGTAAGRSRATPSAASARHGPCGRSIFSPMRA
jgi:hypothetical protein